MSDASFYAALPVLPTLAAAMDRHGHRALPPDWWVLIADVVNSTGAIAAGAYKAVNTVGVASIAAVRNVDRAVELPYLFGGDGATFALPEALRDRVMIAMRGAQRMAAAQFGLTLRAGLVSVRDLNAAGADVLVGKSRLSDAATQPVFSGRGWELAEQWVKSGSLQGVLRVRAEDDPAEASFEGFECRWRNVPAFNDHKLTMIVAATGVDGLADRATYQRVLAELERQFGNFAAHHPLRPEAMRLSFTPGGLAHEARVRHGGHGIVGRWRSGVRLFWLNLVGSVLMRQARDGDVWATYRESLVENSDFRKFDGVLRMVIDATEAQATALAAFLAAEAAAGHLAYGLHRSREALVTCLVESYRDRHLHFVDGSDGGYVEAARQLKAMLAARPRR